MSQEALTALGEEEKVANAEAAAASAQRKALAQQVQVRNSSGNDDNVATACLQQIVIALLDALAAQIWYLNQSIVIILSENN